MVSFAYFLGVTYMLIITTFTGFHFGYLVWGNSTTLEYCNDDEADVKRSYNNGAWQNWKAAFGSNPLLWFIPFSRRL